MGRSGVLRRVQVDEQAPRRRGRPREIWRAGPGTGLPIELGLDDLSPTARAILDAAFGVAAADGAKAITLRAVAGRAHVDVSTIKYHFETRAGLLEGLLDSLYREDVARFAAAAAQASTARERIDAYFATVGRDMMEGALRMRVYAELETLALSEPFLAERLATYNTWLLDAMLGIVFPAERAAREMEPPNIVFWALFAAAVDGIGLHHAFSPGTYPLQEVMDLLQRLTLEHAGEE
jgi:AcrR family transcriptional regulator